MNGPTKRTPLRVVVASGDETLAATPAEDEVRVWVVGLDSSRSPAPDYFQCLTTDERVRAERYKVAKALQQFVTARGLLRRLLGQCLGMAPIEVPIEYNGAGKPRLGEGQHGIHFNVSHTDGLAMIAIARQPVGVDVEQLRAVSDPEGLVARFFSPAEKNTYLGLPQDLRNAAFFKGWTCKEAVIKASGLSVACLDEFDVELHPQQPAELLAARHAALVERNWHLAAWEPLSGYAAALAIAGGA